jgi:hypothetical protein
LTCFRILRAQRLPRVRDDASLLDSSKILFGREFLTKLPETAMAEFLLHSLAQFVGLAKKTAGSRLLRAFALVIHVTVRNGKGSADQLVVFGVRPDPEPLDSTRHVVPECTIPLAYADRPRLADSLEMK